MRPVLITGGAGFVGVNVARSYLNEGCPVHVFDNLSRPGVAGNVDHLRRVFGDGVTFTHADVRDREAVEEAVREAGAVYHLAAQVAVTTSLENPTDDMGTNLVGTVNVLEAIRKSSAKPPLLFTSTNKVYGKLQGMPVSRGKQRWEPDDERLANGGISEDQPLSFLSPYGCSKGSADQYVLDYAHSFGLEATVFRMSCIYGPFQLGSEDQGWVAHFLRQALKCEPVTIFGDGRQVRDLLFVDDLVDAMRVALRTMRVASGQAFNLGGGPRNSISLLELLSLLERLTGERVEVQWSPERLADQKWYVANTGKIQRMLDWRPATSVAEGLRRLHQWYAERPELVKGMRSKEAQLA